MPWLLQGMCRLPDPFVRELAAMLDEEDARLRSLALAGVRALELTFHTAWISGMRADQVVEVQRTLPFAPQFKGEGREWLKSGRKA